MLRLAPFLAGVCFLLLALHVSPADATRYRAPHAPRVNRQGLVVLRSTRSFAATWSALKAALDANAAIRVIATIDHASAAAAAGLSLPPNRVIVFGNPALGTPVMTASRTAGLDLPQKIHVYRRGKRTLVAYNAASYIAARHRTGAVPQLGKVAGALSSIAAAAAGIEPAAARANPRALAKFTRWPGILTVRSRSTFEKTWTRLIAAIEKSPANVAFTVDHGKNSGGKLPPTRLVVFGNPNIGTPFMQRNPAAGIDLPLKILVWEDKHGVVRVSASKAWHLTRRYRLEGVPQIDAAAGAIWNFVNAATVA